MKASSWGEREYGHSSPKPDREVKTKGEDFWLTQALLVSVCEKQLITGTPVCTIPYSLCYFGPIPSRHEWRNPTLKMMPTCRSQTLASLEQSFCLKSYSTYFICLLPRQASFKAVFSANVKWWHGTTCYLSLPSPSPEKNKLNLNKAASFKLNQRKKSLQLVPVNHECHTDTLLTQKLKWNLPFWMICILSFSGV